MAGLWETEDESVTPPVVSLPTPTETPYRTPSRTPSRTSRRSRRSVTPPGKSGKSSSPPPIPGDKGERGSKRSSRDVTNDEHISILDPRRFTPTLHANLVSEILALRRDQEEKTKFIETLEATLHETREESESLSASLSSTAKESRSLKRQLALLEGGTSSALGELARERDEAVETAAETKKRLESSQKRLRGLEEDSERVHDQWAKEKDAWEEEKRKFERKIHVAESRLKVVLEEVAAFQEAQTNDVNDGPESEGEESGKENDAASVRTMSITNSIRFSVMSGMVKPNGNSLADELNFDGDFDDETDPGGRESVASNYRHMRNMSRESMLSRTHRRNQSNDSFNRPGSVARARLALNHAARELREDGVIKEDDETQLPPLPPKVEYVETGVQYSPPPSPKLAPKVVPKRQTDVSAIAARFERAHEVEIPPRGDFEIEANQRRKRVQIGQPLTIKPPPVAKVMVNGSSQTVEEPLSPPKTPKSPFQEPPTMQKPQPPPVAMVTASTQTDDIPPPLPPPSAPISQMMLPIPTISIHPPTSRPSTPREPRLPQQFKDVGCQVTILDAAPMVSSSVQTEEIRIDQRLDRLPAHLHPSAISSRPTSPAAPQYVDATTDDAKQFTPVPGTLPPRNPRRLATKRSLTDMPSSPPAVSSILEEDTYDAYPGNNDDGPLSGEKAPMRRPHRISSLFAGFDGNSSDEVDEFVEGDLSDSEYRTALAPRPKAASRASKRSSTGTATSLEQVPERGSSGKSSMRPLGSNEIYSSYSLADTRDSRELALSKAADGKRASRSAMLASSNKPSTMRKAAMIQSGIASHHRSRSPSLPEVAEPPFPIPTRASSRRPPMSASAPSDGRSSPTRDAGTWGRRPVSRKHYRASSIRKVRSAAAMPRNQRYRRQGSRSPPPFSPSTEAPESPGQPPMPYNQITTPRNRDSYGRFKSSHQSQPSTNTANTVDTGMQSTGSSAQNTGVVDAIAQTMVGEWMFKYVRRRKSFGVADTKVGDENSNDRHKRWVWLAPYERAILWSSKQPSSGSALMGKSGRKLTIQSVLDVKDDNPAPKGSGPLFNRSILILTPQRALKFTAINADRHYIWLTSLSFLAHSQQAVPEILASAREPERPQLRPLAEQFEIPQTKPKPRIRDSIRLTKAKSATTTTGTTLSSVNGVPGPRPGAISVASSRTDTISAPPSIPSVPSYNQRPTAEIYQLPTHVRDMSRDAAEPPFIPRFHDPRIPNVSAIHERANQLTIHGRKRSNTGGHVPPPLSFRGFSGPHHAPTNSTAGNSIGTAGSSDINNSQSSNAMTWTTGSVRTSEASSRPSGAVMNNFFDAIGTVRMEAFISPLAFNQFDSSMSPTPYEDEHQHFRQVARRRSKELRRRQSRSRNRDSYVSKGTRTTTEDTDDWYSRDDPFNGF